MAIVSIIIPHKNIPVLLERCLSSIPDIEEYEVIVVDDNSNKVNLDAFRLLEKTRKYTRFIETNDGKGAGYARNIGLKKATGEWILFADADDIFSSNIKDVISLYISSYFDVIYFKYDTFTESLNKIIIKNNFNMVLDSNNYSDKYKAIYTLIPYSKLIKRRLLVDNKIDFEEIEFSNDIMFSVKVGVCAKEIFIDKYHVIYHYINRTNSLIKIYTKEALLCRLNAIIRVYKYLKKNNYKECMVQMNSYLLIFASNLGLKQFLYVTMKLFFNHLLFYREKGKSNFAIAKYIRIYKNILQLSLNNSKRDNKRLSA